MRVCSARKPGIEVKRRRSAGELNPAPLIASYPLSSRLRFRVNLGTPANINAGISHLAERKSAALERAYAAAGAAAGRHRPAKELLSGEFPEGQALERYKYRSHLRR